MKFRPIVCSASCVILIGCAQNDTSVTCERADSDDFVVIKPQDILDNHDCLIGIQSELVGFVHLQDRPSDFVMVYSDVYDAHLNINSHGVMIIVANEMVEKSFLEQDRGVFAIRAEVSVLGNSFAEARSVRKIEEIFLPTAEN